MLNTSDTLKAIELENYIREYLGQDSNHQVSFNYIDRDNNVQLNVETINPKYNQMFLFHSVNGVNKLDALRKMKEYIECYREQTHSYTIQWAAHGEKGIRTSYFNASSIEEALEKFRYGRDRNKTTIFLISLNASS